MGIYTRSKPLIVLPTAKNCAINCLGAAFAWILLLTVFLMRIEYYKIMHKLRDVRQRRRLVCIMSFGFITMLTYHVLLKPERNSWFGQNILIERLNNDKFVQKFETKLTNFPKTIKILAWTKMYDHPEWGDEGTVCSVPHCVLTHNKSEIASSEAVVFHAPNLWNTILGNSIPVFRRPNQTWILYSLEPPPKFPVNYARYNGVFNATASYRQNGDIFIPYFVTRKLGKRRDHVPDVASTKSAGIAWVASNCGDDARRQLLVREIEKYIPVDKYGKCGDGRIIDSENQDDIISKHKFYLSFENSICRDYITEKFANPILKQTIPIVSGGGDYKSVAPPHSYIDVADFRDAKELADYLNYLDQNDTAYNSYFDWTREYVVDRGNKWCDICRYLHGEERLTQVYTDLSGYMKDDMCNEWTLSRFISRMAQGYAMNIGIV